jgi:hypothetical protein
MRCGVPKLMNANIKELTVSLLLSCVNPCWMCKELSWSFGLDWRGLNAEKFIINSPSGHSALRGREMKKEVDICIQMGRKE